MNFLGLVRRSWALHSSFLKENNKKQSEEKKEKPSLLIPTYIHKDKKTERDMSVIYGYGFYVSSGICSRGKGIIFPLYSICENFLILDVIRKIRIEPGYVHKAEMKDHYVPREVMEIIKKNPFELRRFGNLETMLISLALSENGWKAAFKKYYALEELYHYLMREYSEYIQCIRDKKIVFIKEKTYTFIGDHEENSRTAKELNVKLSSHGKYDKSNFPIYDENMIERIFLPLQFLTKEELKDAVFQAVDNYIGINQMRDLKKGDRFFEKFYSHGIVGKENANVFKAKIEELFNNKDCPANIISLEIYKHLKEGHGNSNKTSFKTMLSQAFKNILFPKKLSDLRTTLS